MGVYWDVQSGHSMSVPIERDVGGAQTPASAADLFGAIRMPHLEAEREEAGHEQSRGRVGHDTLDGGGCEGENRCMEGTQSTNRRSVQGQIASSGGPSAVHRWFLAAKVPPVNLETSQSDSIRESTSLDSPIIHRGTIHGTQEVCEETRVESFEMSGAGSS